MSLHASMEDIFSSEKTKLLEAREFPKMEPHNYPKIEGPSWTSYCEAFLFGPNQEISSTSKSLMRIRDFMSLLLSYPVRMTDGRTFENWFSDLKEQPHLVCDERPLRCVEGLAPMHIISNIEHGERSIFDVNGDWIPEAILNLAADLAVHQLIQSLLSKHCAACNIKYIRLSTRSDAEKRAVKEKIGAALKDKDNMVKICEAFHRTLTIDASTYQSPVESQVLQYVHQLLRLPITKEYATEDHEIFWRRRIVKEMSSNRYLVLLVDRDGEEMVDPWEVGLSKVNLSGVVVFITTESSMEYEDELITKLDLEIRTTDHLLPWQVFCHNVGGEFVCSSSAIQPIAVSIVEECGGHLLAIVLVAKWLKNLQDVELWQLALHKMRSINPSYDIVNFHGLSRVMINTFINVIWDGLNKTQKHCLLRCLFIPKIKDGKFGYELINDWLSSLFVDVEETEHILRKLVDSSILIQFEGIEGRNIRLPNETYEILQSLHSLNPLFIEESGRGLTELPNTDLLHSALKIELADNKLSELPLSPDWMELRVLMLQGNADLTRIPSSFFVHMPLLRILDLSYTSIRELPCSFFNLVQLRELYLKGCECFMKLPPEIGKLQKLEKLDLEETQITHLPNEIQELTNMQSLTLYFYEYRGKKNKPYSCSTIIPSGVISKLKGLRHLSIDVNPDDERWHENVQVILPEILGLECLQTLSLYIPQLEVLKLIPARIFEVDFRFIVGCHMQRIISSIPPTVNVKFKQSDCSLKFVKGTDVTAEIKTLLRHSKALFLDRHITIKNLSEFEMMNLEQLRMCILAECKEMQTIVDGRHSNGNNDLLSRLLFLSVSHMKNLRSIWEGPPPPRCFFGMLQSLLLQSCPKLMTLFSLDFLGNLSLLKELIVKDCRKLNTLISCESSKGIVDCFLPKLRKLSLLHLPELISISSGLHIGPNLKEIGFYGCPQLRTLTVKELSSQELMVIKGETNWWKALEWSKGVWGNAGRPSKFNLIFSPINEEADVMTQLGIYNDEDINDGPGGSLGEPSQLTVVATPTLKSLASSDIDDGPESREKKMENMPPVFRFYPTEEELISFYLHNKLEGVREDMNRVIPVVDVYDYNPWQLPQISGEASLRDTEQWFFFIPRQESEARGGRPKRLTTTGYWKATGSPNYVYSSENRIIGQKRTMVFYSGRVPNGNRTNWKMNEYKAIKVEASSSNKAVPMLRQEFSLCRVYKKSVYLPAFGSRPPPRRDTASYSNVQNAQEPQKGRTSYDHHHHNPGQMVETERGAASSPESSSSGDHGQPSHGGEASQMEVENEPLVDWEKADWFLGSARNSFLSEYFEF